MTEAFVQSSHAGTAISHATPDPLRYRCLAANASPALKTVVRRVCAEYGVHSNDLFSRQQSQRIVRPRHALIAILRSRGSSHPEIGRLVGRDHTTTIASFRRGGALWEQDKKWRERFDRCVSQLADEGVMTSNPFLSAKGGDPDDA